MPHLEVKAWLQAHERDILERWLQSIRDAGLETMLAGKDDVQLQDRVRPLYGAVVRAMEEGRELSRADLKDWVRRHRIDGELPLASALKVVSTLRVAVDTALDDCDAQTTVAVHRALSPRLDQAIEHIAALYMQAMERALTERLEEAEYLAASLAQATEETDRALIKLRTVYDISRALSTSLEVEETFERLVTKLGDALEAQHCAMWLSDVGVLHVVAMHTQDDIHPQPVAEGTADNSLSDAFRSAEMVVLHRERLTRPGDKKLLEELQAHTLVIAPLVVQEISIGVVTLGRQKEFDTTELTLIESVVSQAAIALQNAGLYQEVRALNRSLEDRVIARTRELAEEKERVETLYAIASELSSSLDLDQVLSKTLRLVTQAVGARHGSVMLIDPQSEYLVTRARLGGDPLPPGGKVTPFKPGVGMAGWVVQNRQPVLVHDVLEDERWIRIEGQTTLTRSLIAAPLMVGDDVHGVLLISDSRPNAFDESQLKLVIASAQQVAQAINNAQLYNFVRESAERLGQLLRREQEETSKSQAILQSIADGVIVNDTQYKVIVFNAAAEEILGAKREVVLGQDVRRLFHAFDEEGRADALAALEALNNSTITAASQIVETTLEIGGRVISAHMAPVVTEAGESLGVVTALRDITREVEADRAKTEFVSTVSHELRTPLTSIKGYTDLLYSGAVGPINEQQKRFLGIVKNNADRLTALINDLLDISRIETGRIKLNVESVDLREIVQEVVDSLREQIEGKGLQLIVDLPDRIEEIMGDRSRLIQIVTNLLSNAYKYTDEGWIRISLSPLEGAVRLDVADSGIGIATEDQGKIFERFYRADRTVMEGRGGTGLGLAITKELVELHGGRIWVESELGVGSTFTVILPAAAQQLPPSLLSDLPAGAKKILVVDDERDIVALLRHQLGTQGYQVITASTGGQAIAKAVHEQPDLITLDILLPDRHGFDVLRELKARPETAHIPVIVLSVVQDERSGYRLGAVDYILKPIDEERLLKSISRVLSGKGKILIAEDDPDTADMLMELLSRHGYEPLHAGDGYETLVLARRERPDLILLDLRMPGMDGYEALTRLKKDPETRGIPILAMSAHAVDAAQERLKLQAMGAEDFFAKPLSLDELLAEIERVTLDLEETEGNGNTNASSSQ